MWLCLFGGSIFWLPRFYLTARTDISKSVFLQPVNNTEEMVRFTRFIRWLSEAAVAPLLCFGQFWGLGWAKSWHSLAGRQELVSARLAALNSDAEMALEECIVRDVISLWPLFWPTQYLFYAAASNICFSSLLFLHVGIQNCLTSLSCFVCLLSCQWNMRLIQKSFRKRLLRILHANDLRSNVNCLPPKGRLGKMARGAWNFSGIWE